MNNIFEYHNSFEKNDAFPSNLIWGDYANCPNPVVSIIIPTYKRLDTLETSFRSALLQDCSFEYEIVLVDNNPDAEDSSVLKIVETFNAKNVFYYRNEKNLGMLGNWNRGIELSRGEFITYCHDDDVLLPNALSHLVSVKRKVGDKCILAKMNMMDAEGNLTYRYPFPITILKGFMIEREYYNYSLFDQFIRSQGFGVGCLFDKKHLLEIGGYNDAYYPSADYALQCVYTKKYGCVVSNRPTFTYRIAVNESSAAYKDFVKRDYFFRECMSAHIPIPSFILRKLNDALFRVNTIMNNRGWGKMTETDPEKKDLNFISLMTIIHRLKTYKFTFRPYKK